MTIEAFGSRKKNSSAMRRLENAPREREIVPFHFEAIVRRDSLEEKRKKNRNVGLYTLTYSLAARLKYTCTVYMLPIFYFFIEPRLFFKCLLYSTR